VVIIHGSMGREERMKAQESFKHDPEVQVLVATDAAGEGINLQRAHLMVNYDLPWNPNRIEQRFGRIHRIGQTEVCHLWNLVAEEPAKVTSIGSSWTSWNKPASLWGVRYLTFWQAPVRGQTPARSSDPGHPLRRSARGACQAHDGGGTRARSPPAPGAV